MTLAGRPLAPVVLRVLAGWLRAFADRCAARLALAVLLLGLLLPTLAAAQAPHLLRYLDEVAPETLVEGATGFGEVHVDLPAAPILGPDGRMGWAFVTSDFVGTTGYSGKPIHVMVAVDDDARIIGLTLAQHREPIVMIGIPEARVRAVMQGHVGLDLAAAARDEGSGPRMEIISAVTVTVMVIDDSIVRSGIRVARLLGLGGLAPPTDPTGPRFELDPGAVAATGWLALLGDGTVRRLSLDVGQVNEAFERHDDPRAADRPLTEPPETVFVDMYTAPVSVPAFAEAGLFRIPAEAGFDPTRP